MRRCCGCVAVGGVLGVLILAVGFLIATQVTDINAGF